MPSILVVDDELSIRESFALILQGRYELHLTASGEAALKIIADQRIDAVYLDIRMPGLDGLETLKRLKEIDPAVEIIMITAVNDMQKASQAIKLGARDYVVKPFDVDQILQLTEQILRKKALLKRSNNIKQALAEQPHVALGQSEKIASLLKQVNQLKEAARILLLGEPGTEKELIARLIHNQNTRADQPFVAVALAHTLPLAQVEKLFLGSSSGSSAAALSAEVGLFEQANAGTLFINNLEALPAPILQIMKDQIFSRPGGTQTLPFNAQVIGAAGPDLANLNQELFTYFEPAVITIAPLRLRTSDLPWLINNLLGFYNLRHGKSVQLSSAALEALCNYSWPGNRQELDLVIELLVLASSQPIVESEALPVAIVLQTTGQISGDLLAKFETSYIQEIYKKCGQDKKKTAQFLNLNPAALGALARGRI